MFEEPYRTAGLMLGFIFNLNRDPFKDPRVRQAFNLAFPFEEINKTLFYGQYDAASTAIFDGIPLAADGPAARDASWRSSNEVKDKVPPEVFTDESTRTRSTARRPRRATISAQALKLLKEAGWKLKGNQLVDATTASR